MSSFCRNIALRGMRELRSAPKAMLPVLQPTQVPGWTALLERFYSRAGLTLPSLQQLKDEEVPQPYKSLLVHSWDMTPTLEGFYHQRLGLNVLSRERQNDSYYREVILTVGE